MGGVKLTGKIKSFDKFSLVLESGNLEQLIFKHAISTISVPRGAIHHQRAEAAQHPQQAQAVQTPAPAAPSTGGGSSSGASSASGS
jgi:host factor-I protein